MKGTDMFSELIYTRCGNGIHFLKDGAPYPGEGFKVYACTRALLTEKGTDIAFLFHAAQARHPYKGGAGQDSALMDDAYLYFAPATGASFMQSFHPVKPTGRRVSTFLSQFLIGDFTNFYPFELFGDDSVWDAKGRGEEYYYSTPPTDLPLRSDINDPTGPFGIEELGEFIADGRRVALKTAVAYLIDQYERPPEERTFIAILDESARNIEMWIAAIEHAFSPRIAAAIPFATRMNNFATWNRYTVNQLGVIQVEPNFADKSQRVRLRAMIVGVDKRDSVNAATVARPNASSPFVLLDGKEKLAKFDADFSDPYFDLVTRFDETHQVFCREFLQTINMSQPSPRLFELREAFQLLCMGPGPNSSSPQQTLRALQSLPPNDLLHTPMIRSLYGKLTYGLGDAFHEDTPAAFKIVNWIERVSHITGDISAKEKLTKMVCHAFAAQVFVIRDPNRTFEFWRDIKNSQFASSAAAHIVNPDTLLENETYLKHFTERDQLTFAKIFLEGAEVSRSARPVDISSITGMGLQIAKTIGDTTSINGILETTSRIPEVSTQSILYEIAKTAPQTFGEYIISLWTEYDRSILASHDSTVNFLRRMETDNLSGLYGEVLRLRANRVKRPHEMLETLQLTRSIKGLDVNTVNTILQTIDRRLDLLSEGSRPIGMWIQREKPLGVDCVRSAHIVALNTLVNARQRPDLLEPLKRYAAQGFPSINEPDYISELVYAILGIPKNPRDFGHIVHLFSRDQNYLQPLVDGVVDYAQPGNSSDWNVLVNAAQQSESPVLQDAIVRKCSRLKQGESGLRRMSELIDADEARTYFNETIALSCREVARSTKSPSMLKRLLGRNR